MRAACVTAWLRWEIRSDRPSARMHAYHPEGSMPAGSCARRMQILHMRQTSDRGSVEQGTTITGTTATTRRASRLAAAPQGATSTAPCTRCAHTRSCPAQHAVHRATGCRQCHRESMGRDFEEKAEVQGV